MKPVLRKLSRIVLGIAAAGVIGCVVLFIAIVEPGGSGVLGSVRLADGSEYMVTQSCNWGLEPYTVAFYLRSPGEPWGWCYIDHEANRWRQVAMTYDDASDSIVVTERGKRRAVLDRKRRAFWIDNGSIRRELTAPQSYMDPRYAFR